jgi:hypothetical protein
MKIKAYRYNYSIVSGLLHCTAFKWFRQYVFFLLVSRSIHAKCQILAWNLVLVGCPLKTLHRYVNINQWVLAALRAHLPFAHTSFLG